MLGSYGKFITPMPNGQIRLSIPKDINNLDSEIETSIDLSMQDAMQLYSYMQQPKQYVTEGNTVKEGDAEFDINKWLKLAINEFKK